ncbi:MAG: hypothetical protein H0U61_08220, partial [Nocardioidaceae bacterium]|nr:hypothetical protein [Nocardioidaceae bacterium]
MHTLKKTVISVAAAAALAGGGLAPQIVSALGDDNSSSRHGETEPGDDHGGASGLDSTRDRAERKPGDDRRGELEPGDDNGGFDENRGHGGGDDDGGGDDNGGHGGDDVCCELVRVSAAVGPLCRLSVT